jgi:toxin FitB
MKILVDTNVLSEVRLAKPNLHVMRRMADAVPGSLFLSTITIGEIVYGIGRMPAGAKRRGLITWLAGIEQTYVDRILPIDTETGRIWGELTAICESKGRDIDVEDGLIAATALRHGLHLMTRNTKDFSSTGVLLINPWEE